MIDIVIAAADRLRAQVPQPGLASVVLLADHAAARSVAVQLPAAYVLPVSEHAEPSGTYGLSTQRHACTLRVVLCIRHAGDASGAQAAAALQCLRESVQAALVNWTPDLPDADKACGALAFAAGELLSFDDSVTMWSDIFSFDRWVLRT